MSCLLGAALPPAGSEEPECPEVSLRVGVAQIHLVARHLLHEKRHDSSFR
jgi:hypothetical protein